MERLDGPPRPGQRRRDDAVLRGPGEEAHEDARGHQDLGGRAGPGRLRQLRREGLNRVLFELVPAMSVVERIFESKRAAECITKTNALFQSSGVRYGNQA